MSTYDIGSGGAVLPLNATLLASLDSSSMSVKPRCHSFDDEVSTSCSQGWAEALPCWTKQRVLKLCSELLQGFYSPKFQADLKKLAADSPNGIQVAGRMELALTVQRDVLQKYGFATTVEGVVNMRKAICPFLIDWMVKKMVDDIDRILGLPKDWTSLAAEGPEHLRAHSGQDVSKFSSSNSTSEDGDESTEPSTPRTHATQSEANCFSTGGYSEAKTRMDLAKGLTFSKAQILVLLGDLLEGFSAEEFQQELQQLPKEEDSAERKELVLKVQSKVLPKHNLPGSKFGVMLMLDALTPYIDDFLVKYLVQDMDEKRGLPKDTTANMCKGRLVDVKPARAESPAPDSRLSRQQALSLCGDLLNGFNAPDFQKALQVHLRSGKSNTCVPQRTVLALSVQSKVLPKYGLPGNMEGVLQMLDEIAPYEGDWMIAKLVNSIDEALGLPVETTLTSCRARV